MYFSIWGVLIERRDAECREKTKLLKIEAEGILKIVEKDPVNGLIFFKRLASILGNRLLQTYKMISVSSQQEPTSSLGTGQLLESDLSIA